MKKNYNGLYTAFIFGSILAMTHLIWLLIVYIGYGKTVLDFLFSIHMLNSPYEIQEFSNSKAITLLIVSFLIGGFLGYIYNSCITRCCIENVQE